MTRALLAHRFFVRAAIALAGIFAWLFLFEYFVYLSGSLLRALLAVSITYIVAQGVAALLTPLSAAHLRHGVRRSMAIGALFAALAFVFLGAGFIGVLGQDGAPWPALAFAILLGAYRALYWTPYRLERAFLPGVMGTWAEFILALLPALAGVIIVTSQFGQMQALFTAAAFLVLSLSPLFAVPDFYEQYSWRYLETFRELFSRRARPITTQSFLDGMESAALYLVWPLAIFLILEGSYLALGLVFSGTLLALLALHRPIGALLKRTRLDRSDTVRTVFVISAWIFRIAAGSVGAIIFADSYSYISSGKGRDAALHDHAIDSATYVDEYSVLKELALLCGRIAMVALFAFFTLIMSLTAAFVIALCVAALAAGIAAARARRIRLAL